MYARKLVEHKQPLQTLSKYIVVDAYFSKDPFVNTMCEQGFEIISRLRSDANLNYLYQYKQKRRGRLKRYDGKVALAHLKTTHA